MHCCTCPGFANPADEADAADATGAADDATDAADGAADDEGCGDDEIAASSLSCREGRAVCRFLCDNYDVSSALISDGCRCRSRSEVEESPGRRVGGST